MAQVKTYSNVSTQINTSPWTGTSAFNATVSSTSVNYKNVMTGRFSSVIASQPLTPLINRISIVDEAITVYDSDASVNFPSLPFSTPRELILRNRLSYGVNGAQYNPVTAMTSFSSPTISSTVVRAVGGHVARFTRMVLTSPQKPERTRYIGKRVYQYSELSIFGQINHKLYMDY